MLPFIGRAMFAEEGLNKKRGGDSRGTNVFSFPCISLIAEGLYLEKFVWLFGLEK